MALRTFDVSIITPYEATNLVTNPTPVIDATGYSAGGAGVSVARSTAQTRRSVASIAVTCAAGVNCEAYRTVTFTSGVTYTFSADVLGVAGETYYLRISNAAFSISTSSPTWLGTGYWQRRSWSYTASATETHYVRLFRQSSASTAAHYTDGWQVEAGSEATTYIDGDQTGFTPGQNYRWNGTPNASTSWRSGQTRSGGKLVHISTYAKILALVGMGMTTLTNIGVPSTMGRGYFQNTINNERDFSLVLSINKQGDYALIEKARAGLIAAINPDLVTVKQPVLLQIDQCDEAGTELAETLQISCHYQDGMGMDGSGNSYGERVTLNFHAFVPMFQQDGVKGQALGYQSSVTNANYILQRSTAGVWAAVGTGTNGAVYAFAAAPDGSIYVGGNFTLAGGVANTAYIAKWNGTAYTALGTGMNGAVNALAVGPDGTLYAGGAFTLAGGVANTVRVAKWNGSAWSALGTGGSSGQVYALAFGADGTLYAGGSFALMGGVASTVTIAKWNGSAWSAMGTGTNGDVTALAAGPDGSIYAGGAFAAAGGVANTARVAKWTGTAWATLNSVFTDGQINNLKFAPDGTLYAVGDFTASGFAGTEYLASWNGSAWTNVGRLGNSASALMVDSNGLVYIGGAFSVAAGVALPDGAVTYKGGTWAPIDVNMPGASVIQAYGTDQAGNLYVGFTTSGTATSATVTAPAAGSTLAYPRFKFTGPGTIYQVKNYTTGKAVFFSLTLQAGEYAVLDLDPENVRFYSSWRGDLMNTILPGSNLNFELLPGANSISALTFGGTTAATAISMTWRDQYNGVDGAVR
jgi:hypothetical protein